jgi:hypothetical protein
LVTIDKERARLGPLGEVGLYQLTNAAAGEAAAAGELGTRGKSEPEADRPANVAPEPGDVTPANQATTNGMAIAVNLANAAESDLRLQPLPETNSGELPPAGRSPWFYLIVAAAVLVITEWALFQRRVVA